ncbi:MAG: hypothetical protein IJD70_06435 [Clostridia bacterium]|nr:hypothetical protein [Clostridia bacterium]
MKNKAVKILAISLVLLLFGVFVFLFVNCVISYNGYDLDYDDLKYEQPTFKSYINIDAGRSYWYEIYFEEYEKPFQIDSISQKAVDKESLKEMNPGDVVKVYYRDNSSKKYDFEICEMQGGAGVIISLSDYIKYNQNNQILGMILCAFFAFGVLFCAWTYPRSTKSPITKKKSKKSKKKSKKTKKKYNQASIQYHKQKSSTLPDKTNAGIIALAYFHRYGWIAVMFALTFILRKVFYVWSISMIVYAAWTFIGYKLRWRHIFCSYQNAYHIKMTPERIDWDSIEKHDAYGVPLLFLVMGLVSLCAAILT